jgi:hypothetical protein
MLNTAILKALRKQGELEEDFKEVIKKLGHLEKQKKFLGEILSELYRVDEVFEGVALSFLGGSILAPGEDIDRYCEVYPNAHNCGKTWGLNLRRGGYDAGGEWRGANWPDEDSATLAGKLWVAKGTVPPRDGKE